MTYDFVFVTFPIDIEFRRHRHQLSEIKRFWWDDRLVIQTVTGREAPVAAIGHILEGPFPSEFSIRSYDQRLWWPLLEGSAPMSVENYIARARKSDGPFLSMMNMSPPTLSGPREYGPESFVRDILANGMCNPSRKRRSELAEEIGRRTLFCDGVVYLAGGCPAYFGRRKGGELALELGSLHAEKVGAIHRFLPGAGWQVREGAACRSLIFLPWEVETLEFPDLKINVRSKAECILELPSYPQPSDVCADAVVRRAFARIRTHDAARMPATLLTRLRKASPRPDLISSELCLEAIQAIIDHWPLEYAGLELRWVKEARDQLLRVREAESAIWRLARGEAK